MANNTILSNAEHERIDKSPIPTPTLTTQLAIPIELLVVAVVAAGIIALAIVVLDKGERIFADPLFFP